MNARPRTPPPTIADPVAALFALAWGCCAVIDMMATSYLWHGDARSLALGAGVLGAAVAVVQRRSAARLAILSSLWATHIAHHFPLVPNHDVAIVGVNLTIAVSCVAPMLQRRSVAVPLAEAHALFARVVKVHLLAVYGIAALHKLNWDYLDPAVSCAPSMAREIARTFSLPFPEFAARLSIWTSLGLEVGIPVLLSFRRTRLPALAVGFGFHLVLGFDSVLPILGFSAAVYAIYVLFLPPSIAASVLAGEWLPAPPRRRLALTGLMLLSGGLALSSVLGADDASRVFLMPSSPTTSPKLVAAFGLVVRTAWHALAGIAVFSFARTALRAGRSDPPIARHRPRGLELAFLAFPILVTANGVSPYFGLKTTPCFSMFSNLRTEEGATNHLFLTAARHPLREDDLVEIVDSSSGRLRAMARARVRITYFELRRLLSAEDETVSAFLVGGVDEARAPDFRCDFRRGGETFHVSRAETPRDPVFQRHDWVTSNLVAFRLLPPAGQPMRCLW